MRIVIALLAIISSIGGSGPAAAQATQPVSTSPPSERCARYQAEYEKIQKRLAQSVAEGAMGSAKSLRLRSTEEANLISLGQFSLDSLKSAGCAVPDGPPSAQQFLLAALKCEKAKRAAARGAAAPPPACDQARWQPFKE